VRGHRGTRKEVEKSLSKKEKNENATSVGVRPTGKGTHLASHRRKRKRGGCRRKQEKFRKDAGAGTTTRGVQEERKKGQ